MSAAAAAAMPNGPLQVVFSFDTTGSMTGALVEVRGRISEMLQRLQTDLPAVTTAVVAHGDYCDEKSTYITKHIDFTDDLPKLVDFVNNVEGTGGGDTPEAYEVMLRLVRKDLSWSPGSQRVLVVIGDAYPHSASDKQNKNKIDWKEETRLLGEMGVRIYGAQVNTDSASTRFFKTMTETTDGQHLKLSEFGTLCDVIMAICYREKGAEFLSSYEAEVRAREGRMALHKDLEGVFGVLRRADSAASTSSASGKLAKAASITKLSKTASAAKLSKTASATKLSKAASVTKTVSFTMSKTTKKPVPVTGAAKKKKKPTAPAAKTTTTTKPKSKRFSKTTKTTTATKLNREKVPDTTFRLNKLSWSPWKLAVVPASAEIPPGHWRRVLSGTARARGGAVLRCHVDSAGKKSRGAVICEVAVQTRPGARLRVVWCRVLPTASANSVSLFRLLTSKYARAQLNLVIRNECRVFVRHASISRPYKEDEVKQEVKDVYDYAWCCNGHHRDVWVRNGSRSDKMQIAGDVA